MVTRQRRVRFALALAMLTAGVAACSSSTGASGPDGGSTPDGDAIGCASDSRAEVYASGMSRPGDQGALTFVLNTATPAPPAQYMNQWTIALRDSSGQPVTGATLTAPAMVSGHLNPYMPDHQHGPPVPPQVTANSDGTFTVSNLDFFMGGLWQVTLDAQSGSVSDSTTFSFCIGG